MNRYVLNETSYFGAGCRTELATEVKTKGYKKALLVSDRVLASCGVLDKVKEVLNNAGIAYDEFLEIKQNPTIKNCQDGLEAFKKSGADFIIATAAEVTINYVITVEEENRKIVCVDPKDIPVVAIVDAELMQSMPAKTIASTGMDALTHAIEGYITKGAHILSDMYEIQAIELIAKHLRGAVKDKNIVDMEGMSIGQYVAGMGFSNVGLGIVHSMAHPLGGVYDIAHGVANALLLPIVMEYNMPVCIDKYGNIAKAMGVDITNMSKEEAAKAAIDAVRQLAIDVNIPQTLRELNIPQEGLPRLAKDALADVCTGGNPREVTYEDILKLYEIAY